MKKLTQNEYEKRYFNKNGKEYIVGIYSGITKQIDIKHTICGKTFKIRADKMSTCPYCRTRALSQEKFLERVNKISKDYIPVETYKNCETPITFKHIKCNKEFKMRPEDFFQGQKCPYCMKKKIDINELKKEVISITNGEYTVLEKHNKKFKFFHSQCNKEFEMTRYDFLIRNRRCPHCNGTHKKTTKDFKKELYDLTNGEYSLVGEYLGTNHLNTFIHNSKSCKGNNMPFKMKPNAFLSSHTRCPYCINNKRKKQKDFEKEVLIKGNGKYIVKDIYINNKTPILFFHKDCKNTFLMRPNKFLSSNNRCPYCAARKNEKQIIEILKKRNITFLYDKRNINFDKYQRFDFQILDSNNNILAIIEYDGEFHYKPIRGIEQLRLQRKHDLEKNIFCEQNKIPILRIPYFMQNKKEELINNFLNDVIPSTTIPNGSKVK